MNNSNSAETVKCFIGAVEAEPCREELEKAVDSFLKLNPEGRCQILDLIAQLQADPLPRE